MKNLRTVLFWSHLAAGAIAGIVIFVMSVTGALLALQPQILTFVERDVRTVTPPANAVRLAPSDIVHAAVAAHTSGPDATPSGVTIDADPASSAMVAFSAGAPLYVDPYTGAVLGSGSPSVRAVFQQLTAWHRWLGVEGERRATARAITGASNLAFLGLAVSGLFLWWPRGSAAGRFKNIVWFRRGLSGRARDFNWHNAIGLWSAPVLIVLTATGVVLSYPWANSLLFRMSGSEPPRAAERAAGAERGGRGGAERAERGREQRGSSGEQPAGAAASPDYRHIDLPWRKAEQAVATWSTISGRFQRTATAPVSFTITDGAHWNRFARSQLIVAAGSEQIVRWEPYAGSSRGQKVRGWFRFGHTGELGGVIGQIVAGVASAGGAFLVFTGLSLALRRLGAWRSARARPIQRAA